MERKANGMVIGHPDVLRSVINEASRQHDFYRRRNPGGLECQFWADLEFMATEARREHTHLVIEMRERSLYPLPIKPGEQCKQTPNPNVIKALQ